MKIGILANVTFILISQSWFLYIPAAGDTMAEPIRTVFSNTPRVMLASLFAYAICEMFDVWAYHAWWKWTEKRFKDKKGYLWVRNNGSTLVSQLINVLVFNLLAFAGVFPWDTIGEILVFGYGIFVITTFMDTPFVYLARHISEKHPELLKD